MNLPPNVIWLQWYDEDGYKGEDDDMTPYLIDAEEVTWCKEQINDYDVKYVKESRLSELLDLLQWIYTDGYGGIYRKDIQHVLVKNKDIK